MKKSLKVITVLTIMLMIFTGSAFAKGLLSYGTSGSDVKQLQDNLHTLGYSVGSIDGIFGRNTKKAVLNFQKDHSLSADGIVGPNTFASLEKKLGNKGSNPSSSFDRLLKYGTRGSDVKKLQSTLNSLGYHAGSADGIFGRNTKKAVLNFQKDHSLSADGIVGPNTFASLEKKLGNKGSNPSSSFDRLLKYGTRGSDVKKLQSTLNSLGYHAGSADGIFGRNTKKAVMNFQRDHGLSIDGIVGPATLTTINSQLNSTSSRGTVPSRSIIEKVITTAKSYLGAPYVWGGTSPSGFDCSGFTYYVLKQHGISISRTAAAQYKKGTSVSKSNLQKGDFVFFSTYKSGASHVGIYVGNNQFISSTTSKGVVISSLSNSYWSSHYVGARRIID